MATLRKRLERLEGARGKDEGGPRVIFVCDGATGEPAAALIVGGRSLTREAGETPAAFKARAMTEQSA